MDITCLARTSRKIKTGKEQITLDGWVLEKFKEKLNKVVLTSNKINLPIVIYKRTIEEKEDCIEEEIASISEKFVIVQILTYGGFLPITLHEQHIFNTEEFALWVTKRGKTMITLCLENLDDVLATKN